jgi:hypothetical protein
MPPPVVITDTLTRCFGTLTAADAVTISVDVLRSHRGARRPNHNRQGGDPVVIWRVPNETDSIILAIRELIFLAAHKCGRLPAAGFHVLLIEGENLTRCSSSFKRSLTVFKSWNGFEHFVRKFFHFTRNRNLDAGDSFVSPLASCKAERQDKQQ